MGEFGGWNMPTKVGDDEGNGRLSWREHGKCNSFNCLVMECQPMNIRGPTIFCDRLQYHNISMII